MPIKVSFADLTHTGQLIAVNTIPLGISYVASYAKQTFQNEIDLEIFKYPDDFSDYLDKNTPKLACFSSFSWNIRIGHEYARLIKEASPETITIFGGPNFPDTPDEQKEFLQNHPEIDGYVEFEGEKSFVALFEALKELNFDWEEFKKRRTVVPNLRYLVEGEIVVCALGPKIKEMDIIPSPYLSGMMEKFYDDILIPMIQTTRGCPFTCAFCWEGGEFFRKTNRFSQERITEELRYIAERVKVSDLQIVDANFGMFRQDIDTAKEAKALQEKYGWPKTILAATAKNNKKRTLEIVDILGDTLPPTAAVQSTDDEILRQIQRENVSQEVLIDFAKAVEKVGGQSEAELILCLEGDTKEKHFKTVFDMLDADMTFIRMYQCMMLPGTKSASKATREEFGTQTRFRVLPRCFGTYTFRGTEIPAAEVEEIVIANNTMPYEDYQACRGLHLTVEIFNNDSIFADLMRFLKRQKLERSDFIMKIHEKSLSNPILSQMHKDFAEEEKRNLSETREELEQFTEQPGVISRYIDGEYGTNELYKYRVIGIFEHMELLHQLVYEVARSMLKERGLYNEDIERYLTELNDFSLKRKIHPLKTEEAFKGTYHYDFVALMESNFLLDPFELRLEDGIEMEIYHSSQQKELIGIYAKQYGTDVIGLSRIVLRANMNRLYRSSRRLDTGVNFEALNSTYNKRTKLKLIA